MICRFKDEDSCCRKGVDGYIGVVIDFSYFGLICCDVFVGRWILCIFVGGLHIFFVVMFIFVLFFLKEIY